MSKCKFIKGRMKEKGLLLYTIHLMLSSLFPNQIQSIAWVVDLSFQSIL